MSLFKIAWRSIQQRGVASALTTLTMALGVLLVVAVLLISGIVNESFRTNSSLGYNMIVGAKGGKLQLVLNTVYYLSTPVENIPYSYYAEFLPAAARADAKDGRFAELTRFAIPVCLGDYYEGFRVVGTIPQMFDDYVYDVEKNRKYTFAAGRNFCTYDPEHEYFEAVVGATVARERKIKVGDSIAPTHGVEGDVHDTFFVVGILAPSGSPVDRAVFVNMEGFYLLTGHAKTPSGNRERVDGGDIQDQVPPHVWQAVREGRREGASRLDSERRGLLPLPISQREVTAILLRTTDGLVTQGLRNSINEDSVAQAVLPIHEITMLFRTFVEPIQAGFLLFTALICLISGVSILVSIYNSMNDRRHEIAVMRALGASRNTVMSVVLAESVLLALGGGLLGWVGGHLLVGGGLSGTIEERTGVKIGVWDFAPGVDLGSWLGLDRELPFRVSPELMLIPALILLAILVGTIPAVAAYRTDVSRSLASAP